MLQVLNENFKSIEKEMKTTKNQSEMKTRVTEIKNEL